MILHIGYHKTATSWLQRHVFAGAGTGLVTVGKRGVDHPIRQLVRATALEFDAAACRALFEPLLERIREQGLTPVVSWERLSGHAVSGGWDSKELADRLHAVFPEGKVLVVVREQRSLIVSTYKQYLMAGGRLPVERFLEPLDVQNMRLPPFDLRFFEYEHLIGRYRTLFGPDRVLTLAYDQFTRDSQAFVGAICAYGGHPATDEVLAALPYGDVRRPAHEAFVLGIRRHGNAFRRSELNPVPTLDSGLLRRAMKLSEHAAGGSLVPESVRARSEASLRRTVDRIVGDRYRDSNRATAELTGLDLAGYGWPA